MQNSLEEKDFDKKYKKQNEYASKKPIRKIKTDFKGMDIMKYRQVFQDLFKNTIQNCQEINKSDFLQKFHTIFYKVNKQYFKDKQIDKGSKELEQFMRRRKIKESIKKFQRKNCVYKYLQEYFQNNPLNYLKGEININEIYTAAQEHVSKVQCSNVIGTIPYMHNLSQQQLPHKWDNSIVSRVYDQDLENEAKSFFKEFLNQNYEPAQIQPQQSKVQLVIDKTYYIQFQIKKPKKYNNDEVNSKHLSVKMNNPKQLEQYGNHQSNFNLQLNNYNPSDFNIEKLDKIIPNLDLAQLNNFIAQAIQSLKLQNGPNFSQLNNQETQQLTDQYFNLIMNNQNFSAPPQNEMKIQQNDVLLTPIKQQSIKEETTPSHQKKINNIIISSSNLNQ